MENWSISATQCIFSKKHFEVLWETKSKFWIQNRNFLTHLLFFSWWIFLCWVIVILTQSEILSQMSDNKLIHWYFWKGFHQFLFIQKICFITYLKHKDSNCSWGFGFTLQGDQTKTQINAINRQEEWNIHNKFWRSKNTQNKKTMFCLIYRSSLIS